MVKNTFVYVIIIIFVGIAIWFFIQKANVASNTGDLSSIVDESKNTSESTEKETMSDVDNEWVKLANGLEYQDVVLGKGKEAVSGDMVAAHYVGILTNGTKFDSSYDRGQPFEFLLGGGMVIKGWDIGLVGMKVGGKRKLVIPSELGYGDRGTPNGAIPPGATLLFEVELVDALTPQN